MNSLNDLKVEQVGVCAEEIDEDEKEAGEVEGEEGHY